MPSMLFKLTGRTVIVTGSSKGIGREIVGQMAALGAQVIVSSRKLDDCDAAAAEINKNEQRDAAIPVACDIGKENDLRGLVDQAIKRTGRLDCIVANASLFKAWPGSPLSDHRASLEANVWSAYQLCEFAKPHLQNSDRASIVFISSIAGNRQPGYANISYSLGKAAINKLTLDLAAAWGPLGITVNAICPGLVRTELTKPMFEDKDGMKPLVSLIPVRRFGEPVDIAAQAIVFASQAGGYTTGQVINIAGGYTDCDADPMAKLSEETMSEKQG